MHEKKNAVSAGILIVDDEDDTLFVFSRLLRRLNCPVNAVRTLEDAERAIGEHEYRVVVTDLRLSGTLSEEGLDVLRAAREKNAQVILVTGYGSPAAMTKAYDLGAAYYFEKPVHPAQLLGALETLCRS
jgi:DNA-binding NtrC family response regulator